MIRLLPPLLGLLALLTAGCAAVPPREGANATSCPPPARPPSALLAPEPLPMLPGETWGDVALLAAAALHGLAQCNADKAALRVWAEGLQ
jgi:hypothetical protein